MTKREKVSRSKDSASRPASHKTSTGSRKCQVLDSDGNRCRRKASHQLDYHGEQELYGFGTAQRGKLAWIRIEICDEHNEIYLHGDAR